MGFYLFIGQSLLIFGVYVYGTLMLYDCMIVQTGVESDLNLRSTCFRRKQDDGDRTF